MCPADMFLRIWKIMEVYAQTNTVGFRVKIILAFLFKFKFTLSVCVYSYAFILLDNLIKTP